MEDGERRSSPVPPISKLNPSASTSTSTSTQATTSHGSGSPSSHPPKQLAGQKRDRSKVLLSVTREEGEASSENEAGAYEKEEGEEEDDDDSQPNPVSNDPGSLNVKDGERYISGGGSPMIRASSSGGNANGKGKGDGGGNLDFALPPAKRRK